MSATTAATPPTLGGVEARLAQRLVGWLETTVLPDDLFSAGVFADLTVPLWRVQRQGRAAVVELRRRDHPDPGTLTVTSLDPTPRGFVLAFEERWEAAGQQWYSREVLLCTVAGGRVTELEIYCCGDWDEALQRRHAERVTLRS